MKSRASYKHIYYYILEEFLLSFLVSFLFFFFIFFVNQLLVMAEQIFSKKVPFWDVIRFIVFSLPSIIALSFPFGALVGALMAVGRFSSDNEILAFKASGIPLARLLAPLLLMGILLSLVSFIMNDYFLPLGNIRLMQIYRKILYTNPAIELEPYSIKKYENTVIITGDIEGKKIKDIVIIDKNSENQKRVITARQGFLGESKEQKGVVSLRLEDVFSHLPTTPEKQQFEYTEASAMIYNILLKNISVSFINPTPREMSSLDVWNEIKKMKKNLAEKRRKQRESLEKAFYELIMEIRYLKDQAGIDPKKREEILEAQARAFKAYEKNKKQKPMDRNLQLYQLEFYKKFSVPIACLVFIIFAFPVGLFASSSGRSVGFGIGLLVSALYWVLLFTGHTLGIRMELPPFISMWFPNFVILIIGGILLSLRFKQ